MMTVYQRNDRAVHFYQKEQFAFVDERVDRNTNEIEYVMVWDK